MAYLISLETIPGYWTGNPESVWSNLVAEAKEYATKKEAEKEIKEIAATWSYSLKVVKTDEAKDDDGVRPNTFVSEETPAAEEPAAE